MLFRVFDRGELPKLFSSLAARHEVIGPVKTGVDRQVFMKIKITVLTTKARSHEEERGNGIWC